MTTDAICYSVISVSFYEYNGCIPYDVDDPIIVSIGEYDVRQ